MSTIRIGFPVRRCSWTYSPIVSAALTRKMVRWLDVICAKGVAVRQERPDRATSPSASPGASHGA